MASQREQQQVLFCDLSSATDRIAVVQQLGVALNMSLKSRNPEEELFLRITTQSPTLIVIDNVEQVLSEVDDLILKWSSSAHQTSILCTSRIPFVRAEVASVSITPLALLDGMNLFVQRATRSRASFLITENNLPIIARIVKQLDCLPLAIELAAARCIMLSLEEIEKRLHERFSLLKSRQRATEQRALQGALDWSWDLLSQEAQNVFMQCSVFRGGFSIKAAEHVIQKEDASLTIVDLLETLCDDSLLLVLLEAAFLS